MWGCVGVMDWIWTSNNWKSFILPDPVIEAILQASTLFTFKSFFSPNYSPVQHFIDLSVIPRLDQCFNVLSTQ